MPTDLSLQHEPISDLFPLPTSGQQWNDLRITDQQTAFFHEHGYLAGVPVLSDAQVDRLCEELEEFFQPEHDGRELWYEYHASESAKSDEVLFHALGAWRIGSTFHDSLWNPAFMMPASQLLGGAVRFWHDQLFCKPALHGGVVAWHQDYSYWTRTSPMAHLTCWIALDDSTQENGCVQYVPGSHKWDLLPITGLAGDMEAIRDVLDDDQWRRLNAPTAAEVKRGQCTFHHPLMIHGSFANQSPRPRRALVLNVVLDGVCSDSDEPLLNGTPPIKKGRPLDGQFFPLLFDPQSVG